MILSPETLGFLMAAALMAGCIDAMAGGGGLITLPALMAAGIPPVQAVATNKLQSCFGTFGACVAYARRGHMDIKTYKAPIIAAFIGSIGGAWLVQRVDPSILAGLMPALLITIAAYFTFSPKLGDADRHSRVGISALSGLTGVVGFYDGFFGPGAGAFYTTTPNMALELGIMVFVVVVVGGLGSLGGAMAASLLIGIVTSLAVGVNVSIASLLDYIGLGDPARDIGGVFVLELSSVAATLPFFLMLLVLLLRPSGLLGEKE